MDSFISMTSLLFFNLHGYFYHLLVLPAVPDTSIALSSAFPSAMPISHGSMESSSGINIFNFNPVFLSKRHI